MLRSIDWRTTAAWLRDRLSEPTTRAGIVAFLAAHVGAHLAPEFIDAGLVLVADGLSAALIGIHHKEPTP